MLKLFKRSLALSCAMIVGLSAIPFSSVKASESPIAPTWITAPPRVTFDQPDGVDCDEIVEVTVTYFESSNRQVPFTIEVNNMATILVDNGNPSMISATTNSGRVSSSIAEVSVNSLGDKMELLTSTVAGLTESSFTFQVLSPIAATDFTVTVTTDSPNAGFQKASNAVNVISGLTINAPDVVNDVDLFNVFGTATYKREMPPEGSYVFVQIMNKDPEKPGFYPIQNDARVVDGAYQFSDLKLPSDYEDGEYIITVILMSPDYKLIGYAEKEIQFVKKPDILYLSIYSQVRGVTASLEDPDVGEFVTYPRLYVHPARGWLVPDENDSHGDHTIQAKVILKNEEEARTATGAYFRVHTRLGEDSIIAEFPAQKVGTEFSTTLKPLATEPTLANGQKPYVELVYQNKDGIEVVIKVGELECIVDPSGNVYDAETGDAVEGATCTLYRQDDETGDWMLWVDALGEQANPQITEADGFYQWDVEDGIYSIKVYHPDYHAHPNDAYNTFFDPSIGPLVVPPEQLDLKILLKKPSVEETENYRQYLIELDNLPEVFLDEPLD